MRAKAASEHVRGDEGTATRRAVLGVATITGEPAENLESVAQCIPNTERVDRCMHVGTSFLLL